jgi:hypothetical protein
MGNIGGRGGTLFVVQPQDAVQPLFNTLLPESLLLPQAGERHGRVHPVGNVATEFTNIIKELILIGTSQKLNKF